MKRMIRNRLESQFGTRDPDLLRDFYEEYRSSMTEGVAVLKQQLENGDTGSLVEKSHALKGMASIIGDQDMAALLRNFERAAWNGDRGTCRELLPELEHGLTMLQDGDE